MSIEERLMRVMVIDDDPLMLRVLKLQLATHDYHDVTTFQSARDALAVLESDASAFGLVMCDLQMPDMDGVELIRHMAKLAFPGALVLVSGENARVLQTVEKVAKGRGLRILGVLEKPVNTDLLGRILQAEITPYRIGPSPSRVGYSAASLRQAIDGRELVNHYQPKVNLMTGKITGLETLVRWQHPEQGLVGPDRFIEDMEAHGLINDLTTLVLVEALENAREWRFLSPDFHIAVNVSMNSMAMLDYPDVLDGIARKLEMPASRILLEVTETQVMLDPLASLEIFTRLRLKRFGLAIDDFGMGYSSLAQLRDIPFTELKIDRTFAHGACRNKELHAFIVASLGLASQLGISTVAEGVEDEADWHYLRASGCEQAQGWFIGKPMPATRIARWAAEWKQRYLALGNDAA